jgi:hypothetical protein
MNMAALRAMYRTAKDLPGWCGRSFAALRILGVDGTPDTRAGMASQIVG